MLVLTHIPHLSRCSNLHQASDPWKNDDCLLLTTVFHQHLMSCIRHEKLEVCSLISEDGMDQSKWCLPRVRHLTKALQPLERPRVKLQGCWAHNVCLALHVVEVRQGSDSTMVIESLCKTLEMVHDKLGSKMPKKVLIWVSCQDIVCSASGNVLP